jgi:hypothetical protein
MGKLENHSLRQKRKTRFSVFNQFEVSKIRMTVKVLKRENNDHIFRFSLIAMTAIEIL